MDGALISKAILGDCMDVMRKYPDKYFDLAVVDPPYFSGPERRGYYGSKVSKIGVRRDYPMRRGELFGTSAIRAVLSAIAKLRPQTVMTACGFSATCGTV